MTHNNVYENLDMSSGATRGGFSTPRIFSLVVPMDMRYK